MFNAVLNDGRNAPVTKSFETIAECIRWLCVREVACTVRIENNGANEVLSVRTEPEGNLFYRYDGACWRRLSAEQLTAIFEAPKRDCLLETLNKFYTAQKESAPAFSLMPCPRCGKLTMDDQPVRNALSRHATVYVCNACGMDEAMRDYARTVLPLEKWAFAALVKEKSHVD